LIACDLIVTGFGYNLTASRTELYPPTKLTDELARRAGHDRIMPVNRDWSFAGPTAILPTNSAMAYGLRDVQGYDSLFPGQYKQFMNKMAAPLTDASPPQVGNMVFTKNPASPLVALAGVRCIVTQVPSEVPNSN